MHITRRNFNRLSAMAGIAYLGRIQGAAEDLRAPVAIVKTADRKAGIRKAVELLGETSFDGKEVYLKCNYNSPDPYPATTHPEALGAAVRLLKAKGSRRIILTERSGMGVTREVLELLGALELIRQLKITFLPLEELAAEEWQRVDIPGSHWENGIEVPDFLLQKTCVVQVCNLKTHRFGGQFSASLKNSLGLIAKYSARDSQRNYMQELHASQDQCQMIAEANQVYSPTLAIMDAVQVFIKGGPESGELADSGVIAASWDRVALDAVGLALLRHHGAGPPLNRGAIFDQEQIKRAAELGLGVRSAKGIDLLTDDGESRILALRLDALLEETAS
jgi:uncharacterized protein (DUF362 family)